MIGRGVLGRLAAQILEQHAAAPADDCPVLGRPKTSELFDPADHVEIIDQPNNLADQVAEIVAPVVILMVVTR